VFQYSNVKTDEDSLQRYVELLGLCFPGARHLTLGYLRWLYIQNPCGHAVGMDVFWGDNLAAHYVCVPSRVSICGKSVRALLSLNTATHPNFRGKGLFTKLAGATYTFASELGYSLVYGVANANSTPGFTKKLGFQLVSPLDAKLGVGRQFAIDWERVRQTSEFRCLWDADRLRWRGRNPSNPIRSISRPNGVSEHFARTDKKGISVWCETPVSLPASGAATPSILLPRLFLGLNPKGSAKTGISIAVPKLLRPSPLNFIVLPLGESFKVSSGTVSFSFIDFDAY
jgi:GNAT superfamily N-acetyltransferase